MPLCYLIIFEVILSTKLFVGSLPWSTTDDSLKETFAAFGTVVSAKVVTDRQTGKSRGFGFVEMESDSDASNAIKSLNGSEMNGRAIVVSEAKPKS